MNHLIKRLIILLVGYNVAISASCYSFQYNDLYYNITSENEKTVEVASYSDSDYVTGDISIPSTVSCDGVIYSVTAIGDNAFYECSGLTEVTIPNSVTSIGDYAFEGCSGLTKVNITDLAAWCSIKFSYDDSNPLCYAHHLYLNDNEVTKLVVPEMVTSIGSYAFYGCSGLTEVTIPNSVTSIGRSAFYKCSGLTKVNITDLAAWCSINFGNYTSNPLYYAHHLYLNDDEVTKLVVPETFTKIGDYVFSGCSGLTAVSIPNSVTWIIGSGAFYKCSGLTEVTIPNSVTWIDDDAFAYCSERG